MTEFATDINKIYNENNILSHLPEKYFDNNIYLLVRDPYYIFSYWEIKEETKNEYLSRLGNNVKLALRVFKGCPDSDNKIFGDIYNIWEIGSHHICVNSPNTYFFTQIGYMKDNTFYPLMTSNCVKTPRDNYSDTLDEDWMALEEYYRGLRKISFDIHGSPFIRGKKSSVLTSKLERVSSTFLKQETSTDLSFSEEIIPIHDMENQTMELTEDYENKTAKEKLIKEEFSGEDDAILHPKKRENLSKPPDKITEEPALEPKKQEAYHAEEVKTEPVAAKPQKAPSAIIKKAEIKEYEIKPVLKTAKKQTKTKPMAKTSKKTEAKETIKTKTKKETKKTAAKKAAVKITAKKTAAKKTIVKKKK